MMLAINSIGIFRVGRNSRGKWQNGEGGNAFPFIDPRVAQHACGSCQAVTRFGFLVCARNITGQSVAHSLAKLVFGILWYLGL